MSESWVQVPQDQDLAPALSLHGDNATCSRTGTTASHMLFEGVN